MYLQRLDEAWLLNRYWLFTDWRCFSWYDGLAKLILGSVYKEGIRMYMWNTWHKFGSWDASHHNIIGMLETTSTVGDKVQGSLSSWGIKCFKKGNVDHFKISARDFFACARATFLCVTWLVQRKCRAKANGLGIGWALSRQVERAWNSSVQKYVLYWGVVHVFLHFMSFTVYCLHMNSNRIPVIYSIYRCEFIFHFNW